MIQTTSQHFHRRSIGLATALDTRFDSILRYWILVAGLLAVTRISLFRSDVPVASLSTFLSYALLVFAPFASALLALRWFADGSRMPQPAVRLARLGRWRAVDRRTAERHDLYGTSGIMVSLMIGLLLNVPVRAAEYLTAMPPIPVVAPTWLSTLHFAMTLDVVLFCSLYAVAFVAALRRVPMFPRLLVAIWLGDLAMQMGIAKMVMAAGDLPASVAAALHQLLEGNVKKVLVSIAIWLPYLALSRRVNVTFRHRVEA